MKLPALAVATLAVTALVGGTAAAQATMQPIPNPPGSSATSGVRHYHVHHHHHHWRKHMRHPRKMVKKADKAAAMSEPVAQPAATPPPHQAGNRRAAKRT